MCQGKSRSRPRAAPASRRAAPVEDAPGSSTSSMLKGSSGGDLPGRTFARRCRLRRSLCVTELANANYTPSMTPAHGGQLPRCPHCRRPLNDIKEQIRVYLLREPVPCESCKNEINLWELLQEHIELNFMLREFTLLAGGQVTRFSFTIYPGQVKKVDLREHGIPEDAEVLSLNVSSVGGGSLFPLRMHDNDVFRFRTGKLLSFYPMPRGTAEAAPTEVFAIATWIVFKEDVEGWRSLIEASLAYSDDDYRHAVFHANVAVEQNLSIFLSHEYSRVLDRNVVKRAGHHYRLTVLLPLMIMINGLPALPGEVLSALQDLNARRNDIAHSGNFGKKGVPDKAAMVRMMTAALLSFHYFQILKAPRKRRGD
jgi:hypothetical protein